MELTLKLPDKVKRDVTAYRGQADRFLRGEISPVVFRAYRVPIGIYEQRQSGTYMVRIRIAAGMVAAAQLRRIAELSREYGNGVVHVTTRQDMQIHDVRIEHTPDVLERLLEVGLSSRGGGGNTVRNITACPRAGICPREQFNVAPHALALAEYLLQFDSSYNLPRKFKIAFSGCPQDCSLASVADLGFFAHRRHGMKGFAVYAGGGLGPNPAVAVRIEDFIEEHDIFEVAEAVKRLFDAYGDRSNKHRARLRYVLSRFGREEFVRLYRKERERVKRQGLEGAVPEIADVPDDDATPDAAARVAGILSARSMGVPPMNIRSVHGQDARVTQGPDARDTVRSEPTIRRVDLLPEKHEGLCTVRLRLPLGNVPAEDLVRIADLAETCGTGAIRTTQQQDLLIPSVPGTKLGALREQLRTLGIDVSGDGLPNVVTCAGASTCRLGLCLSRGLAGAIESALRDRPPVVSRASCPRVPKASRLRIVGGTPATPEGRMPATQASATIRISGCPNCCGQHFIADLAFQGHAKRVKGRLMPCYDVLCGGRLAEGDARLAEIIGTLPAKEVPRFVAEALQAGALTKDRLGSLVRKHAEQTPGDIPEDYYRDWGADVPFSLAGRGPGECGAGVMDMMRVDIDEARQAMKQAALAPAGDGRDQSLYRALLASARALLILFGSEPKTDAEVFDAFRMHLIQPGWVEPAIQESLDSAIQWRTGAQAPAYAPSDVEGLTNRVEELFLSLDANLKFRVGPIAATRQTPRFEAIIRRVDLRGVPCPLNFVKAKLAVEAAAVGDVLEIQLDEGEPIQNVPASLAGQGQEILGSVKVDNHFRLTIRRKQ